MCPLQTWLKFHAVVS